MHSFFDVRRILLVTSVSVVARGTALSLSQTRPEESWPNRLARREVSKARSHSRSEAHSFSERSLLSTSAKSRIINGSEVQDASHKYSFFAMPTASPDSDDWLGCGASIISETYGMTAAHCFGGGLQPCSGPSEIALWLGDIRLVNEEISAKPSGRAVRITAKVHCHPLFDGHCSHGHDIVLLEIDNASLPLPDWVHPVRLNLNGTGSDAEGVKTTSIGFGLTESSSHPAVISPAPPTSLREVELTVRSDVADGCARVYTGGWGCSDEHSEGNATNISQQLCAGSPDDVPRDTCSGDSGAPMLDDNGVQIGIVSYGGGPGERMSGPGRICADPSYLGIYSRVSAFSDFITSRVKDLV